MSEKQGENVGTPKIQNYENFEKKEEIQPLNGDVQTQEVTIEKEVPLPQPAENFEDAKNLAESIPKLMNLKEKQKSLDDSMEMLQKDEGEIPGSKSANASPRKEQAQEVEAKGICNKMQNTIPHPSATKRSLRERKPRINRNYDPSSKCHVCGKGSAKAPLIPCTQGSENCDVYF